MGNCYSLTHSQAFIGTTNRTTTRTLPPSNLVLGSQMDALLWMDAFVPALSSQVLLGASTRILLVLTRNRRKHERRRAAYTQPNPQNIFFSTSVCSKPHGRYLKPLPRQQPRSSTRRNTGHIMLRRSSKVEF